MSVVGPPRAPRRDDPVDVPPPGEVPLEALIREARRRARRRRCSTQLQSRSWSSSVSSPVWWGVQRSRGLPRLLRPLGRGSWLESPSKLAFVSTKSWPPGAHAAVWVMNADGTGRRVLTRDAAPPGPVAWSPDGRMLAFVGMQAGLGDIYVVNVDGSGLRRLTHTRGNRFAILPVWSPDGRRIAFARTGFAIGAPPRSSSPTWMGAGSERWSATRRRSSTSSGRPTGSSFFRPSNTTGPSAAPEIHVVNVDGGGLRNLTREWGLDGFPVWSPDGSRIAFSSGPLRKGTLSVMNADGTGRRTLRPAADVWGLPTWSPDGHQLAFTVSRGEPTVTPEIHVMNADGSGERRLAIRAGDPVWSPDGRTIAFLSWRNGATIASPSWRNGATRVSVINADGSGRRSLTQPQGLDGDGNLTWSPA